MAKPHLNSESAQVCRKGAYWAPLCSSYNYVNDIEDHLPATTQLAIYTDDTTLYQCIPSLTALSVGLAQLQTAVDALELEDHIRADKVASLDYFASPSTLADSSSHVQWGGHRGSGGAVKLLGVLFDRSLSWLVCLPIILHLQ